MIVGDFERNSTSGTARPTLDALFRRAAIRDPDAVALADPPDRPAFTAGAPRVLSYAQADRAIWAIAHRLRSFALQDDAVVATQLPNTIESVLTVLAIVRAGLIAAPLPMLWRESEIVAALAAVGAKALITTSRVGNTAHGDVALRAAARLLSIRQICAFGENLPDGVVAMDGVAADATPEPFPSEPRADPAAHAAIVTFEPSPRGLLPVFRNHHQLIAAGATICEQAKITADAAMLSPIPISSFAGLSLTLLPWLIGGGLLSLHQPFDAEIFNEQLAAHDGGIAIVPGPLAAAFAGSPAKAMIALWRAPERIDTTLWHGAANLVDVTAFGEIGLAATRRLGNDPPRPALLSASGNESAIESKRTAAGTLALRGAAVARCGLPLADGELAAALWQGDGFVDTHYPCRLDAERGCLAVTGPQPAMTGIGGYRIARAELDALGGGMPADSVIAPLPDSLLGQRLKGRAADAAAAQAALTGSGANPLIVGAFTARLAEQR